LCLVRGYLRAAAVPAKFGLFWHTPFPPPEVFGICKWREELLQGLLGSDVVGLQTGDDARNFADCPRPSLRLTVEGDPPIVKLGDREVRVVGHGIGVDAEAFAAQARDPAVQQRAERLRQRLGAGLGLIWGDRLGHTKG